MTSNVQLETEVIRNVILEILSGNKKLSLDQLIYEIVRYLEKFENYYLFSEDEIEKIIQDLVDKDEINKTGQNSYYLDNNLSVRSTDLKNQTEIEMNWICEIISPDYHNVDSSKLLKELKDELLFRGFTNIQYPENNGSNQASLYLYLTADYGVYRTVTIKIDERNVFLRSYCNQAIIPLFKGNTLSTSIDDFRKIHQKSRDQILLLLSPILSTNFEVLNALELSLNKKGKIKISVNLIQYESVLLS